MFSREIRLTLFLVWPLLIGIGLIMMGNGLQGTLLGLRADLEGFSTFAIGLIMSCYYVGFLLGCFFVPNMITKVGHIRVFAAMASLASTTILINGTIIVDEVWAIMRIISGFSFAGLFIVTESWLNNIARNRLRGQIFGFYLFILYAGLFSGQFFIYLGDVESISLFIIVSILISISMLPITLANKPSPGYEEPENLPFKVIYKKSPFSFLSSAISGMCTSVILSLASVYAIQSGLDKFQTANLIAAYIVGAATIPLFMGWLSDRFNRRKVLTLCAFLGALSALMCWHYEEYRFIIIVVFGGMMTSIYSISIAHLNDRLKPEQMLSGSSSIILTNSIGAIIGPISVGYLMETISPEIFFPTLSGSLLLLFIYGFYRNFIGKTIDIDQQTEFTPVPARSSMAVMDIAEDD